MRLASTIILLGITLLLGACSNRSKKLTITTYTPGSDSHNAALAIKEVLADDGWDFTIVTNTHEKGVEAVRNGDIDLAITSNEISINARGLRSLIPIYNEVLITLVKEESPLVSAKNLEELLAIAKSNRLNFMFSEKGSYSHLFAQQLLTDLDITENLYNAQYFPHGEEYKTGKIELVKTENPDLITIVGTVDNELIGSLMELGYLFRQQENMANNIEESFYSSFALKMARSFPVVIPEYTISKKQTEAVIAAGLYTSLISNKDLEDDVVYDLVRDIIRAQPELISFNSNFFEMSEIFDSRFLNYQIHCGAMDYCERDEPSFLERYAELAGVVFSMFVVFITLLFTMNRILKQRKKDRIDVYYLEVMKARKNVNYQEALTQLLKLEEKALQQMVDEKLAADSSYIVFQQLLLQARKELNTKLENS